MDLLSVVLWHQHIGVEYLKVVEVGIYKIFFFFFNFSYTRDCRTGGRPVRALCAGPHTNFPNPHYSFSSLATVYNVGFLVVAACQSAIHVH